MDLIASIYAASTEPERWQGVLEQTAEHFGYNSGAILWGNHLTMDPFFVIWHNFDEKTQHDYATHYGAMNPFATIPTRPGLGQVYSTADMISHDEWLKLQYTNEFLIPERLETSLGADLFKAASITGVVEFQRRLRQGRATAEEYEAMGLLVPHLTRACEITWRLWQADANQKSFLAVLDTVQDAIALVDENGSVVHLNGRARRLADAGDGLRYRPGELHAIDRDEDARLQKLMADVVRTGRNDGISGGGRLRLSRPSGRQPLSVLVTAIQAEAARGELPVPRICAALFIRDPEGAPPNLHEMVAALYGLTPAEARVAAGLAEGLSPAEIADRHGVSTGTLRNQLKAVFSKTGTRRQAELVRLVLTLG